MKGIKLNSKKFETGITELKDILKDGLLSTVIFDKDSEEIMAEYHYIKDSVKVYNSVINKTLNIFRKNKLSNIDKYMLLHLEDDQTLVILPISKYRWILLIDNNQVKLGVLLNIIIPRLRDKFQDINKVT